MAKKIVLTSAPLEYEKNGDLLDFPCEFPIKVMGKATEDFESFVVTIVRRHCHDIKAGAVRVRASKGGKYLSVTITFTAHSRAQLDALYTELSHHERVKMVL